MSENLQDSINKVVSAVTNSNDTSNVKPIMNNPQILKYNAQKAQMNEPQLMYEDIIWKNDL